MKTVQFSGLGWRRALAIGSLAVAFAGSAAWAGPSKTFTPGEILRAEDLNERFATIEAASNPPGTIVAYAGRNAPPGWLPCDGAVLDAAKPEYAALYEAIGVAHGGSATSGMFNLPDLRGRFLRGWDNGAGVDPDASERSPAAEGGNEGDEVGSLQQDMVVSHDHETFGPPAASGLTSAGGNSTTFPYPVFGSFTAATGGSETRPTNIAVNYIIKL